MFHHIVKGSEVANGKPAPDIYLECAARFDEKNKVEPTDCLAFEDSASGVKAARAAGMQVVMIPDPRMPKDLRANASLVVPTPHAFRPELFGLPAFGYRPVTHVLFDMDGTLINTVSAYTKTFTEIIEMHSKKFDTAFKRSQTGMRFVDKAPTFLKHYDLPYSVQEFGEMFQDMVNPRLRECKLLAGVERLVNHFYVNGIPMAVATSSATANYENKTANHSAIFDKFNHVAFGDDPEVDFGKPAPDIFLLAAKRFGLSEADYGRCLVFEDAAHGADAAFAAGMQCVLIPGRNEVEPEETLNATQLLQTLEDFRPEDFGLPKFE
jgi:beta-phosphoglucomutase-like phosphatase (HAD superfamily)